MKKTILNDKTFLCYPLFEVGKFDLHKKILNLKSDGIEFYELRIDYMLKLGQNIEDIINDINYIKSEFKKYKFISTIRTKNEGGDIKLGSEKYYHYIEKLISNSKSDYIDVEFKYYKKYKPAFENIISHCNKNIIISKHVFDKNLSVAKIKKYLKESVTFKGNIVKIAAWTNDIEDFYKFILICKECENMLKIAKKDQIYIAMGECGKLLRILPEIVHSKIMFLNAYEKQSILGQVDYKTYIKARKLLAKNSIN